MKKVKAMQFSPAKYLLVITLVTITMFIIGYLIGTGLLYFFN